MRKIAIVTTAALVAVLAAAQAPEIPKRSTGPVIPQAAQLKALQDRLAKGEAAEVFAEVQTNLLRYNAVDLPLALSLSGKARMALAAKIDKAEGRQLVLRQAALDFMRVVTHFPYSDVAAESLLLAGRACAEAGDKPAARSAYEAAMTQFEGTPVADQARQAWEKLGSP